MKALEAPPGTPYTSRWPRPRVLCGYSGVSLGRITLVSCPKSIGVDLGLGFRNRACRLQPADQQAIALANKPVTGWHWRPVREEWVVSNDARDAMLVAHNHLELGFGHAPE